MTRKFKPCPFCGRVPTTYDVKFINDEGYDAPYEDSDRVLLWCTCGCVLCQDIFADLYEESMQKIEAAWNKRVNE